MSYTRKEAFRRYKQLQTQKVGNTTITTPKVRIRTDELHADMLERTAELIEDKMIDLSRWNGEGSIFKYSGVID